MQYDDAEMEQLAIEYMDEGRQAFYENRLNQAALLVQNAIHLFKRVRNLKLYTMSLNLMGVIYGAVGNETMAVDCFLEGLESAIDNHFTNCTCLFYNNIGSRYQELGEHEKAIAYFLKAEQDLKLPECQKEERYPTWCMITYMNLMTSYGELCQYERSKKYLKLAEPYLKKETDATHKYTFLISKCRLCFRMGEREFIYSHIRELLESGAKNENTSDYVQDMKKLCDLFMRMGEYDKWRQIILSFETYAREQDTVYFQLVQTEMWMKYYKETGDTRKYIHLCVDHAELYQKQKEEAQRDRVAAIDMKIELRQKESERRRAELKFNTDPLTGLGNRYLLEKEAQELIAGAVKKQERIAVGVLDIDCFKELNDTYGHIRGDDCLKEVADVLKTQVKGRGRAYRFGGDEFVLLLKNGNRRSVEEIAERIKAGVRAKGIENIHSQAGSLITISQGYSCFLPEPGDDSRSLIEHADQALYQVKENGRDGYLVILE